MTDIDKGFGQGHATLLLSSAHGARCIRSWRVRRPGSMSAGKTSINWCGYRHMSLFAAGVTGPEGPLGDYGPRVFEEFSRRFT